MHPVLLFADQLRDARWPAATRMAVGLLVVAGVAATFGMDRLGLTRSEPYGELFGTFGSCGVGGVGLAWLALGLVLVVGGRRVLGTH